MQTIQKLGVVLGLPNSARALVTLLGMRLLLVTNDFPPKAGGIQQYLSQLVERFEGEIRVLAPRHHGAPSRTDLVRGERRYMLASRRMRRWVRSHVEDFRPDIVVFGAPHPLAQLGPGLRAETGVPYAVITHGAEVTLPSAIPGLRQILSRTLRRADLLFAVSRYTAARVGTLARQEPVVLGAGVDLDVFYPAQARPDGAPVVIGCVSRFVPRKGHVRVIAAAEAFAALGHNVEVLIVGRGRLEKRIRRRVATSTVPVRLEVDAQWSGLAELYREMDVFAMPSRSRWAGLEVEGLGIVYLEAGATGIPVIAGSSGGAPETVIPGVTGFVATSVSELVEALELVVSSRFEMGQASRRLAETEHSWEAVMDRFHTGLATAVEKGTHR